MMNDPLDPRDELTDRLRALGRQPVDTALQSQHLTAIAGVSSGASFRGALATRLRIGAALVAGFLLGTTGLATAGVLGPLQPIAATGVEAVTPLEVPKGNSEAAKEKAAAKKAAKDDKAAKGDDDDGDGDSVSGSRLADGSIGTARYWTGCVPTSAGGTTFAGNRGLYLKQERAKGAQALSVAKASDCGKPLDALDEADDEADEPKADTDKSGKSGEDHGKAGEDHGKSGEDHGKAGEDHGKAGDGGSSAEKRPTSTPAKPERPNDDHANERAKAGAANSAGHGQSGSHIPGAVEDTED